MLIAQALLNFSYWQLSFIPHYSMSVVCDRFCGTFFYGIAVRQLLRRPL
jgi:hypothetical protein